MRILVNSMTQKEIDEYLMRVVECAFCEGMLWEKCGAEKLMPLADAIKRTQINIVAEGNL